MPTISYTWNGGSYGGGDWLPYLAAVYFLVWFFVLGLALTRVELDPVDRLTWVVVIVFVPLGGMLLYLVLSPPRVTGIVRPRPRPGGDISGTPWSEDPGHRLPRDA